MSVFGWGKLKMAAITEQLGDEDALSMRVELPGMSTPVVPDVRGGMMVDIDQDLAMTITPWLRLPIVEYARALAALPAISPRDWQPKAQGSTSLIGKSGETSYIELAGVDVGETMTLVEKLGDVIKGDV